MNKRKNKCSTEQIKPLYWLKPKKLGYIIAQTLNCEPSRFIPVYFK